MHSKFLANNPLWDVILKYFFSVQVPHPRNGLPVLSILTCKPFHAISAFHTRQTRVFVPSCTMCATESSQPCISHIRVCCARVGVLSACSLTEVGACHGANCSKHILLTKIFVLDPIDDCPMRWIVIAETGKVSGFRWGLSLPETHPPKVKPSHFFAFSHIQHSASSKQNGISTDLWGGATVFFFGFFFGIGVFQVERCPYFTTGGLVRTHQAIL